MERGQGARARRLGRPASDATSTVAAAAAPAPAAPPTQNGRNYGWGKLVVHNASALEWHFIEAETNEVADSFVLTKGGAGVHRPAPRAAAEGAGATEAAKAETGRARAHVHAHKHKHARRAEARAAEHNGVAAPPFFVSAASPVASGTMARGEGVAFADSA